MGKRPESLDGVSVAYFKCSRHKRPWRRRLGSHQRSSTRPLWPRPGSPATIQLRFLSENLTSDSPILILQRIFFFPAHLLRLLPEVRSTQGWIWHTRGRIYVQIVFFFFGVYVVYCSLYFCFNLYHKTHKSNVIISNWNNWIELNNWKNWNFFCCFFFFVELSQNS